MSTPLVLTLFTALVVAVIAGIMGAAIWSRSRDKDELESLPHSAPEHSVLFEDVH